MPRPETIVLGVLLLVIVFSIAADIRRIRLHLDRVVPDLVKANKARVRATLQQGDEA